MAFSEGSFINHVMEGLPLSTKVLSFFVFLLFFNLTFLFCFKYIEDINTIYAQDIVEEYEIEIFSCPVHFGFRNSNI